MYKCVSLALFVNKGGLEMNVNQRFIDELFIRKQVRLNSKIYNDLFDIIWSNKKEYIDFLRAEQTDMQIKYAKLIVQRSSFEMQLSYPVSFFQSLIKVEEEGNDNPSSGYVGQDHVVHTVYLYITGIYLYFNMGFFHNHINEYFFRRKYVDDKRFDTLRQTVLCFIKSWKMFSFYHDLGYAIERTINEGEKSMNSEGEVSREYLPYKRLVEEVSDDFSIKAITKCAVYTYIMKRSCTTWEEIPDKFMIENTSWIDETNESVTNRVIEGVKGIKKYVQLHAIRCVEDLMGILPFLNRNRIVAVAQNNENKIVAIALDEKLYYTSNRMCASKVDYHEILSSESTCWMFYYPKEEFVDISKILEKYGLQCYQPHFDRLYENIENVLERVIEQGECRIICEAEFATWKRINEIYHDQYPGENIIRDRIKKYCDYVYEQLTKRFSMKLRECVDKCIENSKSIILNAEKNLDNEIQRSLQSFYMESKEDLFEEAKKTLHKSDDKHSLIKLLVRDCSDSIRGYLKPMSLLIDWDTKGMFNCHLQDMLNPTDERADFVKRISQRAEALNIQFTELINYQPPYTTQDHGVVSTCIAIDIYHIYDRLSKGIPEVKIAKYAFPITLEGEYRYHFEKELYVDAIFSIWLHNVWVKSENMSEGIRYKQRIDINPFSYFSAFCDNCQMWNRRKLVNQGYYERSDEGYAANQFDIQIEESNMLRIICETTNIKSLLAKRIETLNDYLENASELIKVTSIER